MISETPIAAVFDALDLQRASGADAPPPRGFAFELDCASSRRWPDVPFDTADASTYYDEPSRREAVLAVLARTSALMATRAPRALELANRECELALLRRSSVIHGAFSASNRAWIGSVLVVNMDVAEDGALICAEALVHESIHQCLYRIERDHGAFCDLAEERTYRSPWSGNRLPLHSLVHATFVWYGLLSLWGALARDATDGELRFARERVALILHGFAFLPGITESPAFASYSVEPPVHDAIRRMCRATARIAKDLERPRTVQDAMQAFEHDAWIRPLAIQLAAA